MFVVSKRNILLPSADGTKVFPLSKGFMGEVPSWASKTPYFEALVADGKIGVPKSKKDKELAKATEPPGDKE